MLDLCLVLYHKFPDCSVEEGIGCIDPGVR